MKFPQILKDVIDFAYPPSCLLCEGRFDGFVPVCNTCVSALTREIQITNHHHKRNFQYLQGKIFFDDLIFFWNYSQHLETLIHWVKYQRGKRVARMLGRMAGEALLNKKNLHTEAVTVPVPLHVFRFWKRGYNQSDLLANGIAEMCGLPVFKNVLIRKRHTKPQSKLPSEKRRVNVMDAFSCNRSIEIQNKIVYLIDDVATTGATLNNCSQVLKSSGAKMVICIVLARPALFSI